MNRNILMVSRFPRLLRGLATGSREVHREEGAEFLSNADTAMQIAADAVDASI